MSILYNYPLICYIGLHTDRMQPYIFFLFLLRFPMLHPCVYPYIGRVPIYWIAAIVKLNAEKKVSVMLGKPSFA